MAKPNVIVFGYDELLLSSLEYISQTQTNVSAVIFPSTRTDWRANKIRESVKEKGFNTLEQPPRKKTSQFIQNLKELKPDLFYVWSYPMILPTDLINIPKLGSINLHMGLLPEYRGVNGVRWALLNGEKETGMTLHFMDEGIDTGDIIARVAYPITAEDDILSLMKKSRSAGLYLLKNCWQLIVDGKANSTPQDESKANYYSAKMSSIETIDWSKTNFEINNLIRASVIPFPGVYTKWNGQKLVIRKALPIETPILSDKVGIVENISLDGIKVSTGAGCLLITKIELDEKEVSTSQLTDLGLKAGVKLG